MALLLSENHVFIFNDAVCPAYYKQFVSVYQHPRPGA